MRIPSSIFIFFWISTLTACSKAQDNSEKPITAQNNIEIQSDKKQHTSAQIVWQSNYCAEKEKSVKLVESDAELKRITQGNQLNSQSTLSLEDIGDQYHLLLISQGQQSSGGYGIELVSSQAEIKNDAASIMVKFNQPKPGNLQTMALSSPCLLVKIVEGNYGRITIANDPSLSVSVR